MTVPFLPTSQRGAPPLRAERLLNEAQVASLLRYFDESEKTVTDRRSDLCEERVRTERVTTPLGTVLRSSGPFGPHSDSIEHGADGRTQIIPLAITPKDPTRPVHACTVLFNERALGPDPVRITLPWLIEPRSKVRRFEDAREVERPSPWIPSRPYRNFRKRVASASPRSKSDFTRWRNIVESFDERLFSHLSFETAIRWHVGTAFDFPSRQIHCASSFRHANLASKTWLVRKIANPARSPSEGLTLASISR